MCVTWHIYCVVFLSSVSLSLSLSFFCASFMELYELLFFDLLLHVTTLHICPLVTAAHLNGMKRSIICCCTYTCTQASLVSGNARWIIIMMITLKRIKTWKQSTILNELKKRRRHHMTNVQSSLKKLISKNTNV